MPYAGAVVSCQPMILMWMPRQWDLWCRKVVPQRGRRRRASRAEGTTWRRQKGAYKDSLCWLLCSKQHISRDAIADSHIVSTESQPKITFPTSEDS